MRISDWSSDVCSSDLGADVGFQTLGTVPDIEAVADGGTRQLGAQADLVQPLDRAVDAVFQRTELGDLFERRVFGDADDVEQDRGARCRGRQLGRESCKERVGQYG